MAARTVRVRDLTRDRVLVERAVVAGSFLARLLGLMGRRALPADEGLWLPGGNGIHMMFMRFPIDCAFLGRPDADGRRRVVAVRHALPAWLGLVPYVRGADGALELTAGVLGRCGVAVGDLVVFEAVEPE